MVFFLDLWIIIHFTIVFNRFQNYASIRYTNGENPKYHFLHLKNPFDTFTGWVPGGVGYDLPERFKRAQMHNGAR